MLPITSLNRSQIRGAMVAQQKGENLISPMKTEILSSLYGTPQGIQKVFNCVLIELKSWIYCLHEIYIITLKSYLIPIAWRNGGANHFTLIFGLWHR